MLSINYQYDIEKKAFTEYLISLSTVFFGKIYSIIFYPQTSSD